MLASDKIAHTSGAFNNKENIYDLNLYNFENEEASNSPYILTSPRSLKACSLANIRPIELLHRSAADIAKDLNLPAHSISHIYADYEQERSRKLETCKLVRKHILHSYENEPIPKLITHSSPNLFSNRETTSRSSNYTRDDTPEYPFIRENKLRSSYSTPVTPIPRYSLPRKEKNRSLRYSLSSSSSSVSSLTVNLNEKNRPQRSKSVEFEKSGAHTPKKIIKRNISNVKKKSEKHNPKKIKNEIGKKYEMSEVERMNDQQLCWQIDNVKNSTIVSERKKTTNANIPKDISETKKIKNKQNMMEQHNFVKNCEKVINAKQDLQKQAKKKVIRDKKPLAVDFENSAKKLTDKFNESVKNNTPQLYASRKHDEDCDGLGGLKNHDLRILDAMSLKRELQQSQENLAQRARLVWSASSNVVVPSNSKIATTNTEAKQSSDTCPFPENISFDTYFNHIRNKMKQIKEDSLHKELHGEHVRQLARELQVGMEQWQDQVLLLQWQALQRARTNAQLHIENKRLKTQCENNERALLHALRLKNIQNLERAKQIGMKKEIQQKDCKIEKLKVKREREILDCRAQAHYTAELREQLRRTLTPETFDQKVTDVKIKTRFINRSLTASPFTESHIRLG